MLTLLSPSLAARLWDSARCPNTPFRWWCEGDDIDEHGLTSFFSVWRLQYLWLLGTSLSQPASGLLSPLGSAPCLAHPDCPVSLAGVLMLCPPGGEEGGGPHVSQLLASLPSTILCLLHLSPAPGTIYGPSPILQNFPPILLPWYFFFSRTPFLPPPFLIPCISPELAFGLMPTLTLERLAFIPVASIPRVPFCQSPCVVGADTVEWRQQRRSSKGGGQWEGFGQDIWSLYLG